MKIYEKKKEGNVKTICILGVQIYKCIYTENGYCKHILSFIEKTKENSNMSINLFGFKVIENNSNIDYNENIENSYEKDINDVIEEAVQVQEDPLEAYRYEDGTIGLKINKNESEILYDEINNENIKKNKLYVHMGVAKTGSTAIQTFLASHLKELEENNIICPQIFTDDVHITKMSQAGGNVSSLTALHNNITEQNIIVIQNVANKMAEVSRLSGNKNILISSEFFAEYLSESGLQLFFNIFGKLFEIECIIYVRDPLSWYFSRWKQVIKEGTEAESFKEYINSKHDQFRYINTVLSMADNIHIIKYKKNDVYSEFFRIIGLNIDTNNWKGVNINRTLTDSEILLYINFNNSVISANQSLRWGMYGSLCTLTKKKLIFCKPDPALAPLAEQKHEEFFQAIAPYISREDIIEEHPPLTQRDIKFYEDLDVFISIIKRYENEGLDEVNPND